MKTFTMLVLLSLTPALAYAQLTVGDTDPLVVVRDGKYGYIDHLGTVVIDPQFLWAEAFERGYGTVYVCGRYALIDKTGTLLSIETPRAGSNLRPKKMGNKIGLVTDAGELKIKPEFDEVLPFSDGLAAARVDEHWGFIDTSGKFAIPARFDAAYYFREGVGTAQVGDITVLLDKSGKELARGYDVLSGITSEGRIPVSRRDKYGYLDLKGAVAIPLAFDGAGTFSEGLAPVKKGPKWGYIDRDGSVVIPFKFDSAYEFGAGLAPVKQGNETGFINRSGSFSFRLAFEQAPGFLGLDEISDVSRFWTKSGEFGYVNTSGNVIWGPIAGSPDHPPIFGWSAEDKKTSCDVLSNAVRQAANALPIVDE